MIVLNVLIGKGMRRMRNLCEMYAKCMRKFRFIASTVSFSLFRGFIKGLCFIDLEYAKYAKAIFVFMQGVCLTSLWIRIFAYKTYLCCNVFF